jgi:hypothetical protein
MAEPDPVRFHVEPPGAARDRGSALFRPILVVPHAILVGGPLLGFGGLVLRTGALGLLAVTSAFFDWIAILFTRRPLAGLQEFKRVYLRWRARVSAYACFLRDEYPPFGDGPYAASLELPDEPGERDLKSVALRPLLLVPHLVVLFALTIVAAFVWLASWVMIVAAGRLNEHLWRFSRDVSAYALRVQAYGLLLHDRFPSFAIFSTADELVPV